MLAVGYEKYGNEVELERDPIRHLYDVYVKINADAKDDESVHVQANQYFKRMEEGKRSVCGAERDIDQTR